MTPPLYLLDTSVLVHLIRGSELGRHIRDKFGLGHPATRAILSIVTHGEVRAIAARNGWGDKRLEALDARTRSRLSPLT